ncbi:Tachykinin-like peptides receptor 99D [Halotydeus destructor]|nr:Tachykinin-like peptides receptor 99D [Halotydeus destructor]
MVRMMITCVAVFTICWLPFNTLVLVGDQYPEIFFFPNISYVWFACHWLAMSHAAYNPLIYIWMNSRFRQGFRYVLGKVLHMPRLADHPEFVPHSTHAAVYSQATFRKTKAAVETHDRLRVDLRRHYGTNNDDRQKGLINNANLEHTCMNMDDSATNSITNSMISLERLARHEEAASSSDNTCPNCKTANEA